MINRHDDHCNTQQRHPHYSGMKCECGVDAGDPHWYRRKLEILDKMLVAFARCQHYKEFNRRLASFFMEALPDYTVVVHPAEQKWESDQINVWGHSLRYDDGVHLRLFEDRAVDTSVAKPTWQSMFGRALKRERESLEQVILRVQKEDLTESTFRDYQDKVKETIEFARTAARLAIGESVSQDFRKAFPLLFNTDI